MHIKLLLILSTSNLCLANPIAHSDSHATQLAKRHIWDWWLQTFPLLNWGVGLNEQNKVDTSASSSTSGAQQSVQPPAPAPGGGSGSGAQMTDTDESGETASGAPLPSGNPVKPTPNSETSTDDMEEKLTASGGKEKAGAQEQRQHGQHDRHAKKDAKQEKHQKRASRWTSTADALSVGEWL